MSEADKTSILEVVKDMLNINFLDGSFNNKILPYMSSVFINLSENGLNLTRSFLFLSREDGITELKSIGFTNDQSEILYDALINYIYYKTRLSFDPPTNQSLMSAFTENLKELEWRIGEFNQFLRKKEEIHNE